MATIKIKNFKYGLDSRRSEIEAQPGTLVELENALVNQGGEVEKRFKFLRVALPAGTFGAQPTASGIVVFGSAADPGGWVAVSTAIGQTVSYVQLKHPAVLFNAANYDAAKHAMTEIVHSEIFGTSTYALAKFADGRTFGYKDSTLIRDFTDGLILPHLTTKALITEEITAMFNRTAAPSPLFTATQMGGADTDKTNVTGPAGQPYITTVEEDSVLGTITATKTTDPTAATQARRAVGSFMIIAGTKATANTISKVEVHAILTPVPTHRAITSNVATLTVPAGHGITTSHKIDVYSAAVAQDAYEVTGAAVTAVGATTVSYAVATADEGTTAETDLQIRAFIPIEITNAAVPWDVSNDKTAADVALSINTKTSTPEYTARSDSNIVTIYATDAEGDTPNEFDIRVTCAGNVCVGKSRWRVAISGGFTLNTAHVDGVDLLAGTPIATTTFNGVNSFANAVATAIRTNGLAYGYTACAVEAIIYVSRLVTCSSDANVPVFFTPLNPFTAGNGIFDDDASGGGGSGTGALQVFMTITSYRDYAGPAYAIRREYNLLAVASGGILPYKTPVWTSAGIIVKVDGFTCIVKTGYGKPLPNTMVVITDSALPVPNTGSFTLPQG